MGARSKYLIRLGTVDGSIGAGRGVVDLKLTHCYRFNSKIATAGKFYCAQSYMVYGAHLIFSEYSPFLQNCESPDIK